MFIRSEIRAKELNGCIYSKRGVSFSIETKLLIASDRPVPLALNDALNALAVILNLVVIMQ